MIRSEIAALIKRGHVQIDEFSGLNCSQEEATALIPALTNTALAMRIARTIANTPKWEPQMPGFQLRALTAEAKLRLEEAPGHMPQYSNQDLAIQLNQILHPTGEILIVQSVDGTIYPQPGDPEFKGYIEALYRLGDQARIRLEGGF